MPITEVPPAVSAPRITPEQWATYVLEHLSAASRSCSPVRRDAHRHRAAASSTSRASPPTAAPTGTASLRRSPRTDPTGDELVLQPKKVRGAGHARPTRSVDDSNPSVLDAVGTAMTRAVALKADRAILTGAGGKEPLGVYGQAGQHVVRRDHHRLADRRRRG